MQSSGFTLLETIVAISVLTIGIVAIVQIFPLAFSIEKTSQIKTEAALLAQEKIEDINFKGYQDVPVGDEVESSFPSPFERFSRETIITYIDSNFQESATDLGLKKIEIIVSWDSFFKFGDSSFKIFGLLSEM